MIKTEMKNKLCEIEEKTQVNCLDITTNEKFMQFEITTKTHNVHLVLSSDGTIRLVDFSDNTTNIEVRTKEEVNLTKELFY